MPVTISQYVLKVHSRCDLACDHCYVYEHADQSWRGRPRTISSATADAAAQRIAEHAAAHGLAEVNVVLHGGEPLLLGQDKMRGVLSTLSSRVAPVTKVELRIHTNGVRLDEQWCELFNHYGVKVGVSLDGDRAANDKHRRYADGRSSHSQVLAALALLRQPRYRHLYAGILCTIDLANDPVAVYRALADESPPNLDLLLPHATWAHPPDHPAGTEDPYADWLMQVYRHWAQDGRPMPIRLFGSVLAVARGGPSFSEMIGTDPVDLLVIETDGNWEQPDSMKTAYQDAPSTGMNVFAHPVDEVARHPAIAARQRGIAALCATCRACPVVDVCGGGLYAHRYHRENGFDNPSVYCGDLKAFIDQMLAEEAARVTAAPTAKPAARAVHGLPAGAFDALAAGPGDVSAIGALADMRLSEACSLVAAVASGHVGWQDAELRAAAAEGWALLCALKATRPDAVLEILALPYTYAWAVRCLRSAAGADTDRDRAHLAGLAAAAAMRAGVTAELPLPVRDGMLHLPTAGAIAAGSAPGTTEVVSVIQGGRVAARGGGRWLRARFATSPPFSRLAVEDLDPFRDCQEWPATGRLPTLEWLAWRHGLAAAGKHLVTAVPAYARVLGAGLRAVVPARPVATSARSATARQAFGAIAAALPGEPSAPGELAALLLHEFQHVKLNALLDLHELFDPAYLRRLHVPWREDPRPVEGVLHGIYAYLGLTHLRRAQGRAGRTGYLQFRSWVCGVAEALSATGALTRDGERFVAGMAVAAEGGHDPNPRLAGTGDRAEADA
jgi:uncharacterized protein